MTAASHRLRACAALLLFLAAAPAAAQDQNVLFAAADIERRLSSEPFEIMQQVGSRFEGDRTQRTQILFLTDSLPMLVKWAAAVPGGETFNNVPRYEVAVYELQKLFLDEPQYVVPPTVVRAVPLAWYRTVHPSARPTFKEAEASALVVLQYWLWNVRGGEVFDRDRLERDTAYERQIANLNVLTYLVRHNDANQGNFLIANDSTRPRVFAVDNGLSFASEASDRGYEWRALRVKRLPATLVERLRGITEEMLHQRLGVLAQFEVRGQELVPVPFGPNLNAGRGVRRENGVVQLGLTDREIRGVWSRLRDMLEKVDEGDITTF